MQGSIRPLVVEVLPIENQVEEKVELVSLRLFVDAKALDVCLDKLLHFVLI